MKILKLVGQIIQKIPVVLNRAINHWNAEIIEFHLDLERRRWRI